jgi:hypothetical protein
MYIKFTFSKPFQFSLTKTEVDFPAQKIVEMNEFWASHGEDIQNALFNVTGCMFQSGSITCYLNSEFCVSDPLCLKIEGYEDMKDNLIHELIHVLLSQNNVGETSEWKALMEEYKDEPFPVRVHIAIHRIHYLVTKRLFPDRVGHIMSYSTKPAYVRAWKIATEQASKIDSFLLLNNNFVI